MDVEAVPWWRSAVVYQIYIRSFADSGDDGVGDLRGIVSRLPYVASLGVDAIWVTPFYPSPMVDGGYDVIDYRDVDPLFGTLDDADAVLEAAHGLGLRVIFDFIPNHTSDRHPWFLNALSSPAHPDRRKYHFLPPAPDGGPPNNWRAIFGGSAWERDPTSGDYWLHLFTLGQPDLNWDNDEVRADFEQTLRFWFDRGLDGVRIDFAPGMVKDPGYADNPGAEGLHSPDGRAFWEDAYASCLDQPGVHDLYRRMRAVADAYPGDRFLSGEVDLGTAERVANYGRPGQLHQVMHLVLSRLKDLWSAGTLRAVLEDGTAAFEAAGAAPAWNLSNHDVARHVSRVGGGERGRRRARALAMLTLALPGGAYLYAGEELGLEQADVPPEFCTDPVTADADWKPRDGCRVPLPWTTGTRGLGFTEGTPWLPFPPGWAGFAVSLQEGDPASMLELYRETLRLRREHIDHASTLELLDAPGDVVMFSRRARRGTLIVAVNFADTVCVLPIAAGPLLLSSVPGAEFDEDGALQLPPEAAVWVLRPAPRP